MSITEQIGKLYKVKEKIRKAIISKGVDVPADATLDQMADKILEIKVSSNKKEKKHA